MKRAFRAIKPNLAQRGTLPSKTVGDSCKPQQSNKSSVAVSSQLNDCRDSASFSNNDHINNASHDAFVAQSVNDGSRSVSCDERLEIAVSILEDRHNSKQFMNAQTPGTSSVTSMSTIVGEQSEKSMDVNELECLGCQNVPSCVVGAEKRNLSNSSDADNGAINGVDVMDQQNIQSVPCNTNPCASDDKTEPLQLPSLDVLLHFPQEGAIHNEVEISNERIPSQESNFHPVKTDIAGTVQGKSSVHHSGRLCLSKLRYRPNVSAGKLVQRQVEGSDKQTPPPYDYEQTPLPYSDKQTPLPYSDKQTPLPCSDKQTPLPYGDKQTPLPYGDKQIPLPCSDKQTPLPYGDKQTPLPCRDKQTPLPYSDKQTPLPYGDKQTPLPYSDKQTPLPYSDKQTPLPYGDKQTPLPCNNKQTPLPCRDKQTPLPYSDKQTPLPYSDKQTPLPYGDKQTPLPCRDKQTPLPYSDKQTPLPYGDKQTPLPYGDKQTPLPYSDKQTPLPYSDKQTPLPYGDKQTPLPYGDKQMPLPYSDKQAPLPYSDKQTPLPYSDKQTPLPYGDKQTPLPYSDKQTPLPYSDKQTPLPYSYKQTPLPYSDKQTPLPYSDKQTPLPYGDKQTPLPYSDKQTPLPYSDKQTPLPYGDKQTPLPYSDKQTPLPYGNKQTPLPCCDAHLTDEASVDGSPDANNIREPFQPPANNSEELVISPESSYSQLPPCKLSRMIDSSQVLSDDAKVPSGQDMATLPLLPAGEGMTVDGQLMAAPAGPEGEYDDTCKRQVADSLGDKADFLKHPDDSTTATKPHRRTRTFLLHPEDVIDHSQHSISDLMCWTPSSSKMRCTERPPSVTPASEPACENENGVQTCPSMPSATDGATNGDAVLLPKVKLVNGKIVLDAESLVVERTERMTAPVRIIVEEVDRYINCQSFRTRTMPKRWTSTAMVRFYKALSMVGTDFFLMSKLFPSRSRKELKNKFMSEQKKNSSLIDIALDCRLPFDRAAFENFEVVEEPATERRHNKSTKRRKADHQCGMDGGPVTGQPADKHISGVDRTPDSLGHGGSGGDVGAPESRRRRRCRRKLGKLGEDNVFPPFSRTIVSSCDNRHASGVLAGVGDRNELKDVMVSFNKGDEDDVLSVASESAESLGESVFVPKAVQQNRPRNSNLETFIPDLTVSVVEENDPLQNDDIVFNGGSLNSNAGMIPYHSYGEKLYNVSSGIDATAQYFSQAPDCRSSAQSSTSCMDIVPLLDDMVSQTEGNHCQPNAQAPQMELSVPSMDLQAYLQGLIAEVPEPCNIVLVEQEDNENLIHVYVVPMV